ncbi:HisA/HisF-related TIM barrel protein [uncultured Thiodictyon sp.]|uniref:HisA/HisF-related TIM barrel protein n=1 Tax=uncultured Thiodictyon sp. TaxID=1846217 RepID=UPI0025E62B6C|nr:HisA/HisF-related TIM barrel protein [uncultured Thiodictyon sp.]
MKLIPVIDLKGGLVVAARLGDRRRYAPIASPLCPAVEPAAVAAALLGLHPFAILYIADLDAIGGGTGHLEVVERLHRQHPRVSLWVDRGLTDLARLVRVARPVIGSESINDLAQWADLKARLDAPVLSLDYRADQFLGPAGLDRRPDLWPTDLILMTLARVGSGQGPDLDRLGALRRLAPGHRVYAAGGVRDAADLRQLRALGVSGALVSTALHQGRIGPGDLAELDDA